MKKIILSTLLVLLLATACHRPPATTKASKLPEPVYHDSDYILMTAEDLSERPEFFHNKPVKAEGRYHSGFESSRFELVINKYKPEDSEERYYERIMIIWLDKTKTMNSKPADGKTYHSVIVKGVFDTSRHGHMEAYFATIKNAIVEYK